LVRGTLFDVYKTDLLNTRLSTAPTHYITPPEISNSNTSIAKEVEVTHSFANRKRSIVKRRKSVLSASFTAEDEAEAIKHDREATLAALESKKEDSTVEECTKAEQEKDEESKKKAKKKKMYTIIGAKKKKNKDDLTPKTDNNDGNTKY
jgi:hypothetical protein